MMSFQVLEWVRSSSYTSNSVTIYILIFSFNSCRFVEYFRLFWWHGFTSPPLQNGHIHPQPKWAVIIEKPGLLGLEKLYRGLLCKPNIRRLCIEGLYHKPWNKDPGSLTNNCQSFLCIFFCQGSWSHPIPVDGAKKILRLLVGDLEK